VDFDAPCGISFFLNRILNFSRLHYLMISFYFFHKYFFIKEMKNREFIPQTKNIFPNIFHKNLFQAHI